MPNNVTLAISFKTGRIGRSYRGRNYWPGFVEAQVTGNNIEGTAVTAILAAYSALRAMVNATEVWVLGVISRVQGGTLLESGIVTPVTSFSVADTVVDSQRRRLPGRGN